jgi:hypothetical protein
VKLPRPLIIVLIVLLVLFVVSCAVSLARSDEQGKGDDDKKAGLNGGFGDLFKRLTPPTAPLQFPPATVSPSSCFVSSNQLQFGGSCFVTVPELQELRARLLLSHAGGILTVRVVGTVSGSAIDKTTTMPADTDKVDLVFARGDSATVILSCTFPTCAVVVN